MLVWKEVRSTFILFHLSSVLSVKQYQQFFCLKLLMWNCNFTITITHSKTKLLKKKWSSYLISQIFSLTYVMGGGVVRCDSWFYKQTHRKLWMHCWCEKKMHHQAWNLSSNCWIKDNVQYFHDSGTHFSCTSIVKW